MIAAIFIIAVVLSIIMTIIVICQSETIIELRNHIATLEGELYEPIGQDS